MRNNDLDFIKDKFNKAQPDVPSSLDEDLLKYQILSKKEHKTIKFEQKKKINFKPILTAAACFILVFGVFMAVNPFAKNEMKAENFKDYDEINTVVAGLEKWGAGEGMGSGGSTLFQDIYIPDDLNNRGKRIVTNGKYIFYSYYDSWNMENRNKLYIFSAEGENARLINIMNDIAPSDDYEISYLFLEDNSLTVTVSDYSETIIKTYDMSDPESPVLINELRQDGMLTNSYMTDGVAYLVSFYGVAQAEVEGFVPKSENLSIKAKNIYRFENIKTANYMIIGAVDVKSGKRAAETRAILGCYYESYITDGQLYVAGDSAYWSDRTAESEYIRYTFSTGKAVLEAPERVNLPAFIEDADGACYDVNDTLIKLDNNRLISITNRVDLEKREALAGQEIVLYDVTDMSNPLVLDRLVLEDAQSCTDIRQDKNGVFTFSTYFADGERRTDGVESFEITEDKIVSKGEFANQSNLMYYGSDIIVGDYVYSFDKNDEAEEKDKVTIHPYKYK